MNPILICTIITFSISYIWDVSGFITEFSDRIVSLITKGKIKHIVLRKPLSCSLCMTTWVTLIVLLCINPCLCWMSLVFGMSTKYALYTIQLIDKIITLLFVLLERLLNKF